MRSKWHKLLMTRAASQRMMKMGTALWGSQSWLQPAFSRPCAGHEGSLMAQEPPERRLRARLPAPRLFSRKAPPCASERSSELEFGHFQATAPHWWGMLQLAKASEARPSERSSELSHGGRRAVVSANLP